MRGELRSLRVERARDGSAIRRHAGLESLFHEEDAVGVNAGLRWVYAIRIRELVEKEFSTELRILFRNDRVRSRGNFQCRRIGVLLSVCRASGVRHWAMTVRETQHAA